VIFKWGDIPFFEMSRRNAGRVFNGGILEFCGSGDH